LQDGQSNGGQRGLYFLAYQADLERQFEHVWTQWLNAPGFPVPGAGRDALVGQVNWPNASSPRALRPAIATRAGQIGDPVNLSLPAFVTPRYGAYYFAPGIDALSRFSGGTQATAKVPGR
jgi:putative iron-dependent peroxidase